MTRLDLAQYEPLETRLRSRIDQLTDERDRYRERYEQERERVYDLRASRNHWRSRARDAEWGQQQLLRKKGLVSLRSPEPTPPRGLEPTTLPPGSGVLNDGKEIDEGTSLTDRPGAGALEEVAA